MNSRPSYPRNPVRRRSAARSVFGLFKLIGLLSLIALGGWLVFQQTVHSQLRDRIQARIDQKLQSTTLSANLGNARFIEGQGLKLSDLRLTGSHDPNEGSIERCANAPPFRPNSPPFQIEIYEAFIHAPVSMTQLISCELKPAAIQIRRAKIQLTQNAAGDWNLKHLAQQLRALASPDCGPVPVSFSDCTIELSDPASDNGPLQLTDVAFELLPIQHAGRPLFQIRGQFNGRDVIGTNFTVFLDQAQQTWFAEFAMPQIRLSHHLLKILPAHLQKSLGPLPNFSGLINLSGSAGGTTDLDSAPQFEIQGQLREFASDDQNLPLPIHQTSLDFSVNNEQFKITDAKGRLGTGTFQFDYQQTGLLSRQTWSTDGQFTDFDFSHHPKLVRLLPDFCGKLCDEYSPSGLANIKFNFQHDGNRLTRELRGQLTDMSFSYIRFPYRIDHCFGEVTLINEDCDFSVRSKTGEQIMEMKGFVKHPGPHATYEVNLSVPGELPIDNKLLTAAKAQPTLAKVIANFNPTGRVGGLGRIEKRVPGGVVSKSFDLRLKQCHVKHNHFDYPIHNVNGLVQTRNDEYSFIELTGNNNSAQIVCNGNWNPTGGLDLRFLCQSVPLDNQLRFALRPQIREIWQGFRPRGTLDLMRVDLTLPIGESECNVVVEATMSKPVAGVEPNFISINPYWFPYEIKRLTGNVKIGNGKIELTDMAGQHGRTWMVCAGDGHYADDSWSVQLKNLLVGSLKLDDDLLAAVPDSLAPPLRQLSFEGLLNVQGEITLAGQNLANELKNSMAWDLRFDMNQAKMVVGLPLENVFGMVNLIGQYDGVNAQCRGDLSVDSLTVYDAQITKIKGPIWLDNARVAAGTFAKPPTADQQNFSPTPAVAKIAESVTGTMHSGVVKFDAQMSSDPTGEFYLQTTLADGDLKQFCREFAPQLTQISGRSFAALRLAGNYLGTHSYRGDGTIQLRDSKIYELPVMLSLLKILKVREATRTAFDSSNIDFKVSGEDIEFTRIEMLGDAISLLGNGKMNLDRDIDLNFYSVMGRGRINIPVITDLYRASSQQVLWINVDGTLDNPQTHRHVLPQLNDSLNQLFQPLPSNNLTRNWGPDNQPAQGAQSANQSPSTWR